MEPNAENSPVIVYSGTMWETAMVKSLLEDAGIEVFLLDENTGTLAPWYTASGGAGSVKVVVSGLFYEEARSIVVDFVKNIQ